MDDANAYDSALRKVADAYEAEIAAHGGKSLSRVATIVLSSGTFFQRLRDGKPFLVTNLEKVAAYFREPAHWPATVIPHSAVAALTSIGRPPVPVATPAYPATSPDDACDRPALSQRRAS